MQRCSHLYGSGVQCGEETVPGLDFCPDHVVVEDGREPLSDHPFRKFLMRFAALLLLLAFLVPFYYTIKTLYLNTTVEAREAG